MRAATAREAGRGPVSLGKGVCRRKTEKAILVRFPNGVEQWIPQSVVHDDSEVWTTDADGNEGDVVVQAWWHEENRT